MSEPHDECPDPQHWTCAICLRAHVERLDELLAREVQRTLCLEESVRDVYDALAMRDSTGDAMQILTRVIEGVSSPQPSDGQEKKA